MSREPGEFQNIQLPAHSNANFQDDALRPEQFIDINRNVQNPQIIPKNEDEVNINNQETAEETNNVRKDNQRKSAFSYPMMSLKKLFKDLFDLDFSSFDCQIVLGSCIRNFKRVLKLKIYQILCYYPINAIKLLKFLDRKMTKNKRLTFFYFMTRTYEEIYIRYINGNIDFPIIPNGTVRIGNFTTLKKAINTKNKKGENKIKDINKFIDLSMHMLDDLKTEGRTKDEYVDKSFITFEIDIFEKMRDCFNEEAVATSIELEE